MKMLKFRVWDGEKMHDDVVVGSLPDIGMMWNYEFDYDVKGPMAAPIEWIMQYLGRSDKNGRKIYQGDIVRYKWRADIHGDWEEQVGEVYYDEEVCGFLIDRALEFTLMEISAVEVIGNIYENPELVNGKVQTTTDEEASRARSAD